MKTKAETAWPLATLGDHVDLQTGFPFKSKQYTVDNTGVRLLRGDNVAQGCLRWDGVQRWPLSNTDEYAKFFLERGDVILAMDRPWIDAGLKYAWVTERDLPCLLVQRVARMRGTNGLLTDFLRNVIAAPAFTAYIAPIVTGVAVPHISPTQIRSYGFRLPPFHIQELIASILSAYDDLIENNTRRIAILEEMAQALYREWFVNFRFPGHERVRLQDSLVGQIPSGWHVRSVPEIIEIDPPTALPRSGNKPFVPMSALSESGMLIDGSKVESRSGNSGAKFRNGDTLLARITPCLENGKTAFVSFLPNPDSVAFGSTEFIVLRSRTVCPEYTYLLARSEAFRGHAIKSMSGATGRQRAKSECFDRFSVAEPSPAVVQGFHDLCAPIFQQVRVLAEKNGILRQTRDLLLPKLISGELDVSGLAEAPVEAAL